MKERKIVTSWKKIFEGILYGFICDMVEQVKRKSVIIIGTYYVRKYLFPIFEMTMIIEISEFPGIKHFYTHCTYFH